MIYAGLTKNDPRVKAATDWIHKTYSVEKNPGMGQAGVYYYFHAFASAFNASGMKIVQAKDGVKHNWRHDLIKELVKRQEKNGSWTNKNSRWFENNPNLSTSFALISLAHCKPAAKKANSGK